MNNLNSTLGIYIHIPFCSSKCNYCDFYSFRANDEVRINYVNVLIDKIKAWGESLSDKTVDTIYFGGGTPSILGTQKLCDILRTICNSFKITSDCEITLEANPTSADKLNFAELKSAGFNRISLGMQSSIDAELKLLGRRHNKEDVIDTIKAIRKSGIDNISLDVMLGIPEQTKDSLKDTLDFCISLDVPHISTYLLTVESNTVFGRNSEQYRFADEDLQAEFYQFTGEYLNSHGFTHYEISNFCKNDRFSRHNMRYWELKDYLGIGPSAHSLLNEKRFYYPKNMEEFTNDIIIEDGVGGSEEEYLMLMLRTNKGVNFEEYKRLFGNKLSNKILSKAKLYEKHGYVKIDDNAIILTEKGFLLSNAIIADLI